MKRIVLLVVPVVALAACGAAATTSRSTAHNTNRVISAAPRTQTTPAPGERGVVTRAKDGDTYVVDLASGSSVTVRALGIDTPELAHPSLHITAECGGQHAADVTTLLLVGKHVRLVADPAAGDVDRYGRELRYVYTGSSTFQARLVRAGLAKVYEFHGQHDALTPAWERLQMHAAQHHVGTWAACPQAIHQAYDFTGPWQTGPAS